jgi:hypothetical protein
MERLNKFMMVFDRSDIQTAGGMMSHQRRRRQRMPLPVTTSNASGALGFLKRPTCSDSVYDLLFVVSAVHTQTGSLPVNACLLAISSTLDQMLRSSVVHIS